MKDEARSIQPVVNIGMTGHVDHGKSTLVQAITGVWPERHSEELKRGITIKLGYATAEIYKCPNCPPPQCYSTEPICPHCGSETVFQRKISFVDWPGHESLMAVMLSGATIMDGAILVIAANEPCPQPQTREHLAALKILGVEHIIVVQNKVELVSDEQAMKNYEQIVNFLEQELGRTPPIIPISAQNQANIDAVLEAIEKYIPTPKRDLTKPPKMYVARSFDVNKPGTSPEKLLGGVVGGSISRGKLEVGDEIEIKPGIKDEKANKWNPIVTEVQSIMASGKFVEEATPGGLIGVATKLDPSLTKSDALVGNVLGYPNELPDVLTDFTMEVQLLERVVGVEEEIEVEKIKMNEPLMLAVGTAITLGIVTSARDDVVEVKLRRPVCAEAGWRVAISRRVGSRWRLIGAGIIS